MKRALALILFIIICFGTAISNQQGKSGNAVVTVDESTQFSESEIYEAVSCVKTKFRDFKGSELTDIWYDEEKSILAVKSYMTSGAGSVNDVKPENVIVLLSNFKVNSSNKVGFEPNSIVEDWCWILIRNDETSRWVADDWGY